ncbi:DUF4349 domain-containing protein [Streptacidiphilus sp. P02-A3a]|uniref:DUF4349 domain-containing protein n=1 Tax=Streptacidiphilus sp. P02-A3a TaxID=2704468 RepID=UPI0015F7C8A0|nr:DUF4349 domain-containing protein [Streptacidiphilus sp. P02-A3a]QMU72079.1 DUF4349 domain-containing protein [Streptacidiphilus sp. P02-A3a]
MARGTGRTGGGRAVAAAGAGLLAAVLVLSGCSRTGGGNTASNGARAAAPQRAAGAAAGAGGTSGGDTDGGGSGAAASTTGTGGTAALAAGRSLIYTGEMQLSTTGVDAAVTRAEQLVAAAGGYVDAEQTGPVDELPLSQYANGDGSSSSPGDDGGDSSLPLQILPEPGDVGANGAQLVLRIPTADYAAAFQRLLGLGSVLGQERSSQDVTAQVVDVASRVRTQQASVDRVRALMNQAQDINDVISLEAALTQRESDLESLEAEQQALQSQTAMSTVTVQVFEKPSAPVAAPAPRHKGVGAAALGALADGWHGLYLTFRALLLALSAVLPFALVLVSLGWLALRLTRRYRRTGAAVAVPAVPAQPQTRLEPQPQTEPEPETETE